MSPANWIALSLALVVLALLVSLRRALRERRLAQHLEQHALASRALREAALLDLESAIDELVDGLDAVLFGIRHPAGVDPQRDEAIATALEHLRTAMLEARAGPSSSKALPAETARVLVNGTALSAAQSMALRAAVGHMLFDLADPAGLGADPHGLAMSQAYRERLTELEALFDRRAAS